jgi:hypothetical protein
MPIFYRVVDMKLLKTKQRWEQGKYTSSHGSAPSAWYDEWRASYSEDVEKYKLDYSWGIHTKAAVRSFIKSIKSHENCGIWSQNELNAAGELDGVCAWATREQAWRMP